MLNGNFVPAAHHRTARGAPTSRSSISAFPLEELVEPENFLSLLYYFGLLSIRGRRRRAPRGWASPNQTVRRLLYGYLRDGYRQRRRGLLRQSLQVLDTVCAAHGLPRRVAARRWSSWLEFQSRRRPASATTWTARRWCRPSWPRTSA